MQDGNGALLDAVDQHALDARHIFDEAGHDVSRRAVVEPCQREALDVRVEFAAEVENDTLLEVVVEDDAKGVEAVLRKECREAEANEWQQEVGSVLADDLIDDLLGDRREDNHHEGARYGTEERGKGKERVAPDIG